MSEIRRTRLANTPQYLGDGTASIQLSAPYATPEGLWVGVGPITSGSVEGLEGLRQRLEVEGTPHLYQQPSVYFGEQAADTSIAEQLAADQSRGINTVLERRLLKGAGVFRFGDAIILGGPALRTCLRGVWDSHADTHASSAVRAVSRALTRFGLQLPSGNRGIAPERLAQIYPDIRDASIAVALPFAPLHDLFSGYGALLVRRGAHQGALTISDLIRYKAGGGLGDIFQADPPGNIERIERLAAYVTDYFVEPVERFREQHVVRPDAENQFEIGGANVRKP